MDQDDPHAAYQAALNEMTELGEVWLERHVQGQDNEQVRRALQQVERESRKYERKLRKRRQAA